MTKAKYPGWRTMNAAQRHNARQDAIWEACRDAKTRFNAASRGLAERATRPDFDPTCIFCETGEEHEH